MKENDLIYVEDVVNMYGGKINYRCVLSMIREHKLKAMKAGKRYILSRAHVESYISKQLGLGA